MVNNSEKLANKLGELEMKLDSFPISAHDVAAFAEENGFDKQVVNFYRSFPPNTVFNSLNEFIEITDEVELLERGMSEQPIEELRSPV